jgi:hypothetical protein
VPEPTTGDTSLEPCNTLWIGGRLTALATACLQSFVATGHAVRLYAYEPIDGVPAGVAPADAATIVSADRLRPYLASRSYASFANLFRYELLAREPGVWIDCDLLSVRPLISGPAHLFGYEAVNRINNAVLKLPADSPVLADLRAVFTTAGWRPPWNDWKRNLRDRVRRALGHDYSAVVTGPRVLTYFVEKHGLTDLTAAMDVFYPVAVHTTPDLLNPGFDIRQLITPRTLCIHLCSSYLGDRLDAGAPAGSFLASVLDGSWRARLPDTDKKVEG